MVDQPLQYALSDPRDRFRSRPISVLTWVGTTIAYLFAGMLLVALCTGVLMLMFGAGAPRLAIVGILLLAAVTAGCARSARRQRGFRILAYIEQAVRANLPLPQMIRAAAESERSVIRSRLQQLEYQLLDGASLSAALTHAVPEATDKAIALIHSAERSGNLAQTLHQIINEHRQLTPNRVFDSSFHRVYTLFVFAMVGLVTWMLMIFVMPKFQAIMRDFRIPLPAATQLLLRWGLSVTTVLGIMGLIALVSMLVQVGRDTFSPSLRITNPLKDLIDLAIWPLPMLGRMQRDRGLADVCGMLAAATRVGRPIQLAIVESAQPHLNSVLRGRLLNWAERINAGEPLDAAARAAWLPGLLAGTLATARSSANLPAAFEFLARYYGGQFSRTWTIIRNSILPAIALLMGLLVLGIALSLFMPIISLIEAIVPKGRL